PQSVVEAVAGRSVRHLTWQAVQSTLAGRAAEEVETPYLTNLLASLFNSRDLAIPEDVGRAVRQWDDTRARIRALP
ncbi:MAG: hypothetical protein HUU14_12380, partial [Dehalococcoidia bacterium]|nr:hypothetical protein [Dehalococcoidia bacterium]